MADRLAPRLEQLKPFISGTAFNPFFYDKSQKPPELEHAPPEPKYYKPRAPIPDIYNGLTITADEKWNLEYDRRQTTGEPIDFPDGFIDIFQTRIGPVRIIIDSREKAENDPYDRALSTIIAGARQSFENHPDWTLQRRLFEIGLLCFGNYGQQRHQLYDYQDVIDIPEFMLGELILRINVEDLECAFMSLAMQVVGSRLGINIKYHSGFAARFSFSHHSYGPHAWCTVEEGNDIIYVDWTNYPPALLNLFESAGTTDSDKLFQIFKKDFGLFGKRESRIVYPTKEQYDRFQDRDLYPDDPFLLLLGTPDTTIYYDDFENPLGSCLSPSGWDKPEKIY